MIGRGVHDDINLRMWLWLSYQYHLTGILIWSANYWNSTTASPPGYLQNPWEDPMSYTVGYGLPFGKQAGWGNGDGRFVYPANRDVNGDPRPYVEGPVDSLRWEMLREGLEDYEYFWLLRECVNRGLAGAAESAGLLQVPESMITDMTTFARDPRPLYAHRQRLARALERAGADRLGEE